ncbi:MAG: hypothetical protein KGJ78_14355 [Alphaproteobacteria bacterium]|nr:hypothetical protein [Alphaproteobacteria bacterium]
MIEARNGMALKENRLCVFCGKTPDTKTREHVVPYWLLEITGDPLRVVTFGQNFDRQKQPIRYSWSQYIAPACDPCNNHFSHLERRVKPTVEALLRREALPASAYITLLDWLDKVRIGVWLLRHMIEKHPIKITPNFHIASRIAEKDRMLAVYTFDGDGMGINLFGSDSLIFGNMPSCFGLRINNILLLNVSSDFFCSRGCGLPYPKSIKLLMGGPNQGTLKFEGFGYATEVSNPITNLDLFKPVVWIYQPIKLPWEDPIFRGGFYGHVNQYDSRLAARTLQGNARQGAVFRQYADRVDVFQDPSAMIAFDNVVGDDCAMIKDIAASVYEAQINLFNAIQHEWIEPEKPSDFDEVLRKLKLDHTGELAKMYRDAGQHRP